MLRVYDEIRRPRVNRIWDDTFRTGNIVDGLGKHGPTHEGLHKDLYGTWDYAWNHDADEYVVKALHRLRKLGAFASDKQLSARL